jgi:hypothetical protein
MSDAKIEPVGRVTAVYRAEPVPTLLCSHCQGEMTDDDAHCPTCDSPIDWGASFRDLKEWTAAVG